MEALDNEEMLLVLRQALTKKRVLIVDRHPPARDSLRLMLSALEVTAVHGAGTTAEVLRQVKADESLRRMPVVMLTTADDPSEVDRCHTIGCSNYIVKPINYDSFAAAIATIGCYIALASVPPLSPVNS